MKTISKTILLVLSLCVFCACESSSSSNKPEPKQAATPRPEDNHSAMETQRLVSLRKRIQNYKQSLEEYERCVAYQELSSCTRIADQLNELQY
jgi:hypothetical protein